jgi:hypothetical protein
MKNHVHTLLCVLLTGLISGGVWGCGVTSEVATTHPSTATSMAIGPSSEGASINYPPTDGRPRAPRLVASTVPVARVAERPSAVTARAADRSVSAAVAEANAVALGSPTRRIQSGRIVDEAGQPLVGATVLLKGTNRGASTDANGDYSLPVPLGINTFIFAYSGYEQEVAQSRDGQPLLVTLLPAADRVIAPLERPTKPRARKKHQ